MEKIIDKSAKEILELTGSEMLTDLTVMQVSCESVQAEIVKAVIQNDYAYLIDLGGLEQDLNLAFKVTRNSHMPLHLAVMKGLFGIVQILMTNPTVQVNRKNRAGENSLYLAACRDQFQTLKLLKEKGCYYEPTENGCTPLHAAAKAGSVQIIEYFLEKAKDLQIDIESQKYKTLHTPLHFACYAGCVEAVKLLVAAGAKVNALTNADSTPVYLAARSGSYECIRILIENGGLIDSKCDLTKSTPIMAACKYGHAEIVKYLYANGADINVTNENDETPLIIAARHKQLAIVALLAAKVKNIDYECKVNNHTAFMSTCLHSDFKGARILQKAGAKIDHVNRDGATCLLISFHKRFKKSLKFLIALGADKFIRDKDGITFEKHYQDYKNIKDDKKKLRKLNSESSNARGMSTRATDFISDISKISDIQGLPNLKPSQFSPTMLKATRKLSGSFSHSIENTKLDDETVNVKRINAQEQSYKLPLLSPNTGGQVLDKSESNGYKPKLFKFEARNMSVGDSTVRVNSFGRDAVDKNVSKEQNRLTGIKQGYAKHLDLSSIGKLQNGCKTPRIL